jgi:fatty-acyl-CoA synthase
VQTAGIVGDIHARSESLFSGYYNRPDLTATVMRDGWYRTGDQGFVWSGEVYVLGRTDDVIVVAGKNIYPQDVEEIASSHPDVHAGRAVAFSLFNPDLGTQEVVIVAEAHEEGALARSREIEGVIRGRVMADLGISARIVALVPPRWIVKSTAGKPARSTTRRRFLEAHPELGGAA